MSVKTTSAAWEIKLPAIEKIVLLYFADQASDAREFIEMPISSMAETIGMTERGLRNVIGRLRERGLVETVTSPGFPTRYKLRMERGSGVVGTSFRGGAEQRSGVPNKSSTFKERQERESPSSVASHSSLTTSNREKGGLGENKQTSASPSSKPSPAVLFEVPKERKRFVPPTREEVRAYVAGRGGKINADHFHDRMTAGGWMVGKNKCVDWKACVRTWEHNAKSFNGVAHGRMVRTERPSEYPSPQETRERLRREGLI